MRSKVHTRRVSEIDNLRHQLEEAQETLRAITAGEVDALVIEGPHGNQVFTLKDADRPYRHLAEQMSEGACTLNAEAIILFANSFLAQLLGVPMEQFIGSPLAHWVCPDAQPRFARLLQQSLAGAAKGEIELVAATGESLPVELSLSLLQMDEGPRITAVVFDLRERKRNELALRGLNRELERRVAERTVELAVANEDLRARGKGLQGANAELEVANEELEVTNEELKTANEELAEANRRRDDEISRRKRIEDALKESEQKANDLIRYAPTAIYEIDFRGPRFTRVNDAMCAMSGYTREELLAMSPFALLDPDSQERFQERTRKTFAGEPIDELVEYRAIVKDGRELYVTLQTRFIYEGDKPVGAFVIGHDVTERKHSEQRLRESEARFRVFAEAMPQVVWSADASGAMDYYNARTYEYGGLQQGDINGWDWAKVIHPDDLAPTTTAWSHSLATGEPYQIEQRLRRADGEYRWHLTRGLPTRDEQGCIVRWIGTATDIHDQKQIEAALRESEKRYRLLHESLRDPFVEVAMDGRLVEFNDLYCDLLGYPPEELRALTYRDLTPERWQAFEDRIVRDQIMARGYSDVYEKEYRRKDGTIIPVELRTVLSCDDAGQPKAMWAIVRDISERKVAEEQIRRLNQELEQRAQDLEAANEELRVANEEQQVANEELHTANTQLHSANARLENEIAQRKRVEEALQRSEERYRTIIETANEGIAIHEPDGTMTYVNQRMADMMGYSREEMIGKSSINFVDDEERAAVMRARESVKAQGSFSKERKLRRKDGSILWTLANVSPRQDGAGNYLGYLAMHTDITERKRVEEALRESEERYRGLFENLNLAVLLVAPMLDRDGRVVDLKYLMANPAVSKHLKLAPEGMVGRRYSEVFQYPGRNPVFDIYGQVLTTGEPYKGEILLPALHRQYDIAVYRPAPGLLALLLSDITERKKTEEALRESEERYRDLVESSNSIIMRADENLNITYMNPFGLAYFGYTAEELIGKNVMGTTIPMHDDAGRDLKAMVKDITLHPEKYKTNVHQNRRKNGELVWVSWTNKVTYDRDGKFIDILAIGNDIDQIRKAEEAKRQSEALLQAVLDSTPDPVYIKDRTSRMLLANRALSQVVGKPLEQIIGKTDSEYYDNAAVGQALREHDLQVMTVGTSAAFEETVNTPEGERTFLSSKAPYRNASGEIIGITGISRDITERKRMEEALRQATRQAENHQRVLESVIQQMPAGVILTDATGAVARNNKAMDRIWRRDMLPSENVDQHGYVAYHPDGREYRLEEWPLTRSLRAGEEILGEEMVILRGDGTKGTVFVSSAPIRDNDGKIIAGVVIDVDISELKQAEELIHRLNRQLEQRAGELELANKELESFSYSVSHDLRTPLASINGFANLLLQEQGTALPDDARRLVDLIQKNSAEMSQLVDGLLRFSRSIRQPLTKQTVDLNSLARQVVEDLKAAQAGRRVDVVLGALPPVRADPVLLKQVLTNLLSNALKFTRQREVATIDIGSTTNAEGEIAYHVRDNGVGFDAAHAPGLFGVFQRFHSEEEYEGTGIGLAIVERIVRRHGGRVWAEAQVGQGATFYFSLPA